MLELQYYGKNSYMFTVEIPLNPQIHPRRLEPRPFQSSIAYYLEDGKSYAEKIFFSPRPEVNLGPLPEEGRGKNPPSFNNSQSLQGVNYHQNQVYFWKWQLKNSARFVK